MFKLFSKNTAEDTEFTQEIQEYKNIKAGHKALLDRAKFVFYLAITLILLTTIAIFSYAYSNKLTKDSIISNRSIMINVLKEEVLVGSLYNSPETEEEKAITTDTPEPTSNIEPSDAGKQTDRYNDKV